ncbi:MAG: hypothetical protein E7415_00755 [Ruminococcaceae bacterium]|nr:hypothetical protein [Oscillospiraceae bacterium]
MKKGIIVLTVILMMTLISCGKNNHSDYSEIYESFSNIENYCAVVDVTVSGDEKASEYRARQYYVAPDLYRLDFISEGMEDISCVLNGEKLHFKGPDGKVTEFEKYIPEEKYYIFITDFMERYVKSETAKSYRRGNKTVLELEESGENPQRASMKLYINNRTRLPDKLQTFNEKGEKVMEAEFSDFKMNTKIDKKIFEL